MMKIDNKGITIENEWLSKKISYEIYFDVEVRGGKGNAQIMSFNDNVEIFYHEIDLLKRLIELKEKGISINGVLEVERRSREYRVR